MKQAVVIIHGIGEQKPMATLRAFVTAVLGKGSADRETFRSKPDPISELMELRRLQAVGRPTTHFYEYYWAYNVENTRVRAVLAWFGRLVIRSGRNVPSSAKAIWGVARGILVMMMLALLLVPLGSVFTWVREQSSTIGLAWLALTGVVLVLELCAVYYLGDAARYLSPAPANIRLRSAIRAEGVRLLRTLHSRGEYDRIIVVGHSLGSVIGYDLITHLWQEYNEKYQELEQPDVQAVIRQCQDDRKSPQPQLRGRLFAAAKRLHLDTPDTVTDFQTAQQETWREQRALGNPWRITDFITLGSPLAHGMLLMAGNRDDFESRQRQRELPTCPPQPDQKGYAYSAPTPVDIGGGRKFTPLVLHHAAPFAVTRWTNLYFPARLGLFGDLVGGPLRQAFGPGIRDIPVRTRALRGLARYTLLAHTRYWFHGDAVLADGDRTTPGLSLRELKAALELERLRRFTSRPWSDLDAPP